MIDTQSLQVVKEVFSSSLILWAVITFRLVVLGAELSYKDRKTLCCYLVEMLLLKHELILYMHP